MALLWCISLSNPVSSTTNLIMEYALGIDKDILGVAYSLGRASWAGMVLGKFV